MAIDQDQIRALVQQPVEGLQIELKTWLDPRTDDGVAKLVKAIFAIRNRNGGFLLIGFNNATGLPDTYTLDESVEEVFHVDVLQALVSRYSYASFEISVVLAEREGQKHPIIVIPEGVRVPAVVRRDLNPSGNKPMLSAGDVYFRTLNTNGTASSARITPGDYADLLEVCFENREADIGRFLRRHLSGLGSESAIAGAIGSESKSTTIRKRAFEVLDAGVKAFHEAIGASAHKEKCEWINNALTMRVGLFLDPQKPDELSTQEFMNRVGSSNPNFTGWPVWLDSRSFRDAEKRPYVHDRQWQALIVDLDDGWSKHVEFLRFDPKGAFYLQRVMQDDLSDKVEPGTALDVVLMIYRVAEVLAVGTNLGRSLGWVADAEASFAFRWSGLNGRALRPWVNALWSTGSAGSQSRTAEAEAFVLVPLETPYSALAPYVTRAVAPLFAVFDGYAPTNELVETCVRKLVERKMDS